MKITALKKKTVNNFITNAVGENITINNVAEYILGNIKLCRLIIAFLFAIGAISCMYDILKISVAHLFPYISGDFSLFNISELPFFCSVVFCFFMIFYSKKHHSFISLAVSALLMAVSFVLRVFSADMELINDITIIPISMGGVSIILLLMFEKISTPKGNKPIHKV